MYLVNKTPNVYNKHRIINNIPRVRMTTLVVFIFSGAILVWYKMNIYNIIYVYIITLLAHIGG